MARQTTSRKVKKLTEILRVVRNAKRRGLKVVTTNGAFDLIHVGHVRNLEFAKSLGDILIVGVNSDASVRAYKGPKRPIMGEHERAEIVASLKPVDHVFIFGDKNPIPWLKKIKPDFHVKGAEWGNAANSKWKIKKVVELPTLKKIGARLVFAPFFRGRSSTNLIAKITALCPRGRL